MTTELLTIGKYQIPCTTVAVAVVGTGAAGYDAADSLYDLGVTDVLLVTEGKKMGTSRNTGSDKQTYYKLNLAGGVPDSVYEMARSLMRGGSMHGDIALSDAALSARCFFKLVGLGVPFPTNEYGEYVGYRTDHDATTRATSCGPLTSKKMTEVLERAVEAKRIPLADGHRVISILTDGGTACGLITVNRACITPENPCGLCAILAGDVVYAVGGPSAIYADTVYPESQTCALGAAFAAGAAGANLTEWQYGPASVAFRWNVSGTYQQVLPRYISTDADGGDEREFLADAFDSPEQMLAAVFAKGYEWPFDPNKTGVGGSSRIDLAIYRERQRGRRVFLDYLQNPSALAADFGNLNEAARDYLEKSGALVGTPIERLRVMNEPAIALYRDHGIDLASEALEIAVSAQHCNGGIAVNRDRSSTTLRHFYAIGECAGTFGVHRPGGSALNATQTGALLAATAIAEAGAARPSGLTDAVRGELEKALAEASASLGGTVTRNELFARRTAASTRMSACAALLREPDAVAAAMDACGEELHSFTSENRLADAADYAELRINLDILLTQRTVLGAILDYLSDGGESRGSFLVTHGATQDVLALTPMLDTRHAAFVQNTVLHEDFSVTSFFEPVRPLPQSEQWFETVWNRQKK